MVDIHITQCKGTKDNGHGGYCGNKYIYVCTNCGMGGCSTVGCTYQGFNYTSGGLFSSSGAVCVRCGEKKGVKVS